MDKNKQLLNYRIRELSEQAAEAEDEMINSLLKYVEVITELNKVKLQYPENSDDDQGTAWITDNGSEPRETRLPVLREIDLPEDKATEFFNFWVWSTALFLASGKIASISRDEEMTLAEKICSSGIEFDPMNETIGVKNNKIVILELTADPCKQG